MPKVREAHPAYGEVARHIERIASAIEQEVGAQRESRQAQHERENRVRLVQWGLITALGYAGLLLTAVPEVWSAIIRYEVIAGTIVVLGLAALAAVYRATVDGTISVSSFLLVSGMVAGFALWIFLFSDSPFRVGNIFFYAWYLLFWLKVYVPADPSLERRLDAWPGWKVGVVMAPVLFGMFVFGFEGVYTSALLPAKSFFGVSSLEPWVASIVTVLGIVTLATILVGVALLVRRLRS